MFLSVGRIRAPIATGRPKGLQSETFTRCGGVRESGLAERTESDVVWWGQEVRRRQSSGRVVFVEGVQAGSAGAGVARASWQSAQASQALPSDVGRGWFPIQTLR